MSARFRHLLAIALAFLLAGCGTITHKQTIAREPASKGPRHIAIFFDGTNNDESSDTNVKKLHSLLSLQQHPNLSTLYVEGVGTGSDVAGMTTGYGFGERVRIAYAFLLAHHQPGDKVYIFGFSRGAYTARVLNSLLYHAGLPRRRVPLGLASAGQATTGTPSGVTGRAAPMQYTEVAEAVYDIVEVGTDYPASYEPLRRQRVQEELVARQLADASVPAVEVEVLGLWDTVEALGMPNWMSRVKHKAQMQQHLVNVDNGNSRYGDKLCNVQYAFHAVSIDDNREWIFTPLLLTRRHLVAGCDLAHPSPMQDKEGRLRKDRLREVWFAGAHSDVGGGYLDTRISGVSLNWMLQELARTSARAIIPFAAGGAGPVRVPEDRFGTTHDPEAGAFSPLYHAINRDIAAYVQSSASLVPSVCVHPSVFERRSYVALKAHENAQLQLRKPGRACLVMARQPLNSLDGHGRLEEHEALVSGSCPEGTALELDVKKDPEC
jgi:uncharacterized protein (DUF2235 family)